MGPPCACGCSASTWSPSATAPGRIGLLDERCAHRCASLFLGRNEHDGLRCVFHGWKYDVTGQCVDQMNEPALLRRQSAGHRLSDRRAGRADLGLPGAARQAASATLLRVDPGARVPPLRLQDLGGVQLAAGAGGRHRHLHAPILHRALTNRTTHQRHCPCRHVRPRQARHRWRSTSPITATCTPASGHSTGIGHTCAPITG